MIHTCIASLVQYGIRTGLITADDRVYTVNRLLEALGMDSWEPAEPADLPLEEVLRILTDDAVSRGLCDDGITARDLFDTRLMGLLTPTPGQVRGKFRELYADSPEKATDWFYQFSQDTNYIRRDRIRKDLKWQTATAYGDLDITVNLSKPEKDPKAIAAAKTAPQSAYPKCQLCGENEGYAGRINHPARQNHRIIPLTVADGPWYFQYSPYVYYNEHCIVLNAAHTPMVIDRAVFGKLLDVVTAFPHYFVGSNADLPIVGGSILSHEHFQGGRYCFPMERAAVETVLNFPDFADVQAGIVNWPMSVIRLTCEDRERLIALADRILTAWRGYSDESADILAYTDAPHNTVTPIARRRGTAYELDLVLRNNRTTAEHPLGLFHPHAELHHIKKENIGLIEVMGLAVLPARLKTELAALEQALVEGLPLTGELEKHSLWAANLQRQYEFTAENAGDILRQEVGRVFARVLEDAGVFKRTAEGKAAFLRFAETVF